eukprot:PITA_20782
MKISGPPHRAAICWCPPDPLLPENFIKIAVTMNTICYGKWTASIAPVVMLLCLFSVITAQPGFLSISCGGKTNHTGENNITWIPDAHYIDVGQSADIGDAIGNASRLGSYASLYGSYLHTMRYFPKPLNKSCYQLPVTPDVPHLLRLWFPSGFFFPNRQSSINFDFSIETMDMSFVQSVMIYIYSSPSSYEHILVTKGRVLYICLVKTSETDDPSISAIEMRRLQHGMYKDAQPGTILFALSRFDVGGNSRWVRYPQDRFDRIWTQDSQQGAYLQNISSIEAISTNNTNDLPPTAVLQTAGVVNLSYSIYLEFSLPFIGQNIAYDGPTLLMFYFAEVERLNMSQSRSFSFSVVASSLPETITLRPNYSAQEITIHGDSGTPWIYLQNSSDSSLPPIINAYEYYGLLHSGPTTNLQDTAALNAIKSRVDIKGWISADPCYLIPWEGISCESSSVEERIVGIDLSGRNLTGWVPSYFAKLTALVNLSLDDNDFTGPMPNLANLTKLERLSLDHNDLTGPVPNLANLAKLERLYLQNNNLNGTAEWLSHLISLQELSLNDNQFMGPMPNLTNLTKLERLNIENNNFSGVFPAQLLHNCSLKLNYSGNPYLQIGQRECNLQNGNTNKSKDKNKNESTDKNKNGNTDKNVHKNKNENTKLVVVLGILFIALIIDQFVKLKIKEKPVTTESSGAKKEHKHFLKQDRSKIIVPNTTKSRAFTLDEMIAATQSFTREIGRGGFGSVFFGELPQGKTIAVKVLSLSSHQGIQEFLNEVDLLSKINHRNLVSLLGYCNETDQVMLIYEHMSGGSLRDHLYGSSAENSDLNWKRRLKIALDAAQGLEYLHVGCTPKIIHRDIKTANILLDSNFNGKLADFGLSRMATDVAATHVTTAVKGTFGYLDPEYYNTQMLTEKSDVYSFGVLLLEIITGRPPIDTNLPDEEVNIVRWATPYLLDTDENGGGKIIDVIDKRLCGGYDMKSASNVAKIAMRCVQALPSRRPTVSEVVAELKEAIKVEEDKDCISIAEENGIQNGDVSTKREGMEWNDDSSNMPNVGR